MKTGGPAFPVADTYHPNGQVQFGSYGMTLLDWFAGQALAGLVSESGRYDAAGAALDAYDLAAAMLAEKSRREAVVQESSTTDHSGEANKMVELEKRNRELVERIKRLENAGNEVVYWFSPMAKHQLTPMHLAALNQWNAAKETKP